jgi:hypothetical protein
MMNALVVNYGLLIKEKLDMDKYAGKINYIKLIG